MLAAYSAVWAIQLRQLGLPLRLPPAAMYGPIFQLRNIVRELEEIRATADGPYDYQGLTVHPWTGKELPGRRRSGAFCPLGNMQREIDRAILNPRHHITGLVRAAALGYHLRWPLPAWTGSFPDKTLFSFLFQVLRGEWADEVCIVYFATDDLAQRCNALLAKVPKKRRG